MGSGLFSQIRDGFGAGLGIVMLAPSRLDDI